MDHRALTAHGFRWIYDETHEEGGAHVYQKEIPARIERIDAITSRIFDRSYLVMRLFEEDLEPRNFELMARLGLTRTGAVGTEEE